MRNIFITIFLFTYGIATCQQETVIPKLFINQNVTTHFIMSEPITYVDISIHSIRGDQPEANILRVRPIKQDKSKDLQQGIITIVCQSYMVQYQLVEGTIKETTKYIRLKSSDGVGILNKDITITTPQMKALCLKVLEEKATYNTVKSTKNKLQLKLNNIFTIGDYFFIDLLVTNKTNIKYDIDQIRFKIEDKKKVKRTNNQDVEIYEVFKLYDVSDFKKRYRNIFVFDKFTFPDEKVFTIELAEEQVSGRMLKLDIDYIDVLNADTL